MRGLDPLRFFFVDCFSTCVQWVCVTVCSNWQPGGLPGNNERLGSTLDAVVSQRLAEAEKHTKRGTAKVAQWGLADAHLPHPANLYAEWEALGKGGKWNKRRPENLEGVLKLLGFPWESRKCSVFHWCVHWSYDQFYEMMPEEASDLSGAELEAVPCEQNDFVRNEFCAESRNGEASLHFLVPCLFAQLYLLV